MQVAVEDGYKAFDYIKADAESLRISVLQMLGLTIEFIKDLLLVNLFNTRPVVLYLVSKQVMNGVVI